MALWRVVFVDLRKPVPHCRQMPKVVRRSASFPSTVPDAIHQRLEHKHIENECTQRGCLASHGSPLRSRCRDHCDPHHTRVTTWASVRGSDRERGQGTGTSRVSGNSSFQMYRILARNSLLYHLSGDSSQPETRRRPTSALVVNSNSIKNHLPQFLVTRFINASYVL